MKDTNVFYEKVFSKKVVHKGKAVSFRVDEVLLANGKKAIREFMVHPGAVAVLALTEKNEFVMVRQYRYPVGKITYEIPAGKLQNKNDAFLKRAKAELKEETGYSASKFTYMLDFWPTPAFSDEVLRIYLATGLKKGISKPDEDEFLDVFHIKDTDALDMVLSGEIKDSKTVIAVLYYFLKIKRSSL